MCLDKCSSAGGDDLLFYLKEDVNFYGSRWILKDKTEWLTLSYFWGNLHGWRMEEKNKKKLLPQLSYLLFDDGGELSANALPPIDLVCEKWIILLHVLRTMTHIN